MKHYIFTFNHWFNNKKTDELIIASSNFEALQIFKKKFGKKQLKFSNITNFQLVCLK